MSKKTLLEKYWKKYQNRKTIYLLLISFIVTGSLAAFITIESLKITKKIKKTFETPNLPLRWNSWIPSGPYYENINGSIVTNIQEAKGYTVSPGLKAILSNKSIGEKIKVDGIEYSVKANSIENYWELSSRWKSKNGEYYSDIDTAIDSLSGSLRKIQNIPDTEKSVIIDGLKVLPHKSYRYPIKPSFKIGDKYYSGLETLDGVSAIFGNFFVRGTTWNRERPPIYWPFFKQTNFGYEYKGKYYKDINDFSDRNPQMQIVLVDGVLGNESTAIIDGNKYNGILNKFLYKNIVNFEMNNKYYSSKFKILEEYGFIRSQLPANPSISQVVELNGSKISPKAYELKFTDPEGNVLPKHQLYVRKGKTQSDKDYVSNKDEAEGFKRIESLDSIKEIKILDLSDIKNLNKIMNINGQDFKAIKNDDKDAYESLIHGTKYIY